MNGYQFLYLIALTAVLGFIGYAAVVWGSVIAIIFLVILVTLVLIGAGAGIALAVQRMANEKTQQDFINNAKENMAIMGAIQKAQNLQTQNAGRLARLPDPTQNGGEPFVIDYNVFDELED